MANLPTTHTIFFVLQNLVSVSSLFRIAKYIISERAIERFKADGPSSSGFTIAEGMFVVGRRVESGVLLEAKAENVLDRRRDHNAVSRTESQTHTLTHAHSTAPHTPHHSSTSTMMLQSLARGTLLRRSLAATSAAASRSALGASTTTRAMGTVTYSPPAVKIGKSAPDFTAVGVGEAGG